MMETGVLKEVTYLRRTFQCPQLCTSMVDHVVLQTCRVERHFDASTRIQILPVWHWRLKKEKSKGLVFKNQIGGGMR